MLLSKSNSRFSGFRSLNHIIFAYTSKYLPMHNVQLMNIFNSRNDLMKKSASIMLFDTRMCHYVIKKFTPSCIFHNKIQLLWCFDDLYIKFVVRYVILLLVYFIKVNDIRMSNEFQDMNFSCDSFHICNVANTRFFQYFNRNFLARKNMCC